MRTTRVIIEIIVAIATWTWSNYVNENLKPELQGMAIAFCIALIIEFLTWAIEERKLIGLYIASINFFKRAEIRLTIAYLFRIEVNGKFLLVRSNRVENLYQPVGGVYKYFHPEATKDLHCMGVITDTNITNDDDSEFDLRVKMKNKTKLRKFLKWFFAQTEREIDPWREFYEELVASGILQQSDFGYVHYELTGQHFEPIHYDEFFKIDTFKYVDIYIPKYVNNQQIEAIRKLSTTVPSTNPDFIWVTEEEIKRKKSNLGHSIAEHSYKIFHTKKLN